MQKWVGYILLGAGALSIVSLLLRGLNFLLPITAISTKVFSIALMLMSTAARIASISIRGIAAAIRLVSLAILANPIVLAVAAIAAAVTAIVAGIVYLLYKYVKPVREFFNKIAEWGKVTFGGLIDWILNLWQKVVNLFKKVWEWIFPKGGMYAELEKEKAKLGVLNDILNEAQKNSKITPTMDLSNMDEATSILTRRYAELGLLDSKPLDFTHGPLQMDHTLGLKPPEINIKVESTGEIALHTERGTVYSPLEVAVVSSTKGY